MRNGDFLLRRSWAVQGFAARIIKRLLEENVEFVIVGGLSAILQGAEYSTLDLDLCYRRTPENIGRLVKALNPLRPRPRGFPEELPFVFDERTVLLGSNFTLDIDGESLDLLGEMSAIGGFEQVIGQSLVFDVENREVPVLSLAQLIESKRAAGRPKDLAVLPLLEETLKRRQSQ